MNESQDIQSGDYTFKVPLPKGAKAYRAIAGIEIPIPYGARHSISEQIGCCVRTVDACIRLKKMLGESTILRAEWDGKLIRGVIAPQSLALKLSALKRAACEGFPPGEPEKRATGAHSEKGE